MVETDFVPDLRPGDDHAHEVLPTCSPYGASMFLLSFLPAQIKSNKYTGEENNNRSLGTRYKQPTDSWTLL